MERSPAVEAVDLRRPGFGMLPHIANLLRPGQQSIVELGDAGNVVRFGFIQEPHANEAVERSSLPGPSGVYRRLWISRIPSTAQLRSRAILLELVSGSRRTWITQPMSRCEAPIMRWQLLPTRRRCLETAQLFLGGEGPEHAAGRRRIG